MTWIAAQAVYASCRHFTSCVIQVHTVWRTVPRSAFKCDSAAMPACRDLGETFKWAFVGTSNADTAFFADAAHNTVKDLDADMPFFLTGTLIMCPCHLTIMCIPIVWYIRVRYKLGRVPRQLLAVLHQEQALTALRGSYASDWSLPGFADNSWFGDAVFSAAYHPNPSAPSCVPCNYSRNTSELAVLRPVGCPCRPEQLCLADKDQQVFPNASQYCGIPRYLSSALC